MQVWKCMNIFTTGMRKLHDTENYVCKYSFYSNVTNYRKTKIMAFRVMEPSRRKICVHDKTL